MRRILLALALVALALPMAACTGCGQPPTVGIRWPLTLDPEPQTVAGPRYVQMPPQWAVPSYSAVPGACAPSLPGYTFSAPTPCK